MCVYAIRSNRVALLARAQDQIKRLGVVALMPKASELPVDAWKQRTFDERPT
jgi:hypothetical protein